jgi:hypothetical protein
VQPAAPLVKAVPASQPVSTAQAADPGYAALPDAQLVHAAAPAAAYVLAGQRAHAAAVPYPGTAYVPAAQGAQPLPSGTLPAAQLGQTSSSKGEQVGASALLAQLRAPQHENEAAAHAVQLPLRSAG